MKMPVKIPPREKVIGNIIDIPVERIVPNPSQPRRNFSDEDISELAESIESNGLIQPLTVRENNGKYEIVAGERRFRAAVKNGYECVPCIIVNISGSESAVMALVENIQRKDLTFFEEAEAYRSLISLCGITQEEAAQRLGKRQSTVANKLRLLKFSDEEKELICRYELTERHARALLKIDDREKRIGMIKLIGEKNMNVSRAEKEIELLNSAIKKNEKLRRRSSLFRHMSLFANSVNHAVDIMRASGVECSSERRECNDCVEFIIRISKEQLYEK